MPRVHRKCSCRCWLPPWSFVKKKKKNKQKNKTNKQTKQTNKQTQQTEQKQTIILKPNALPWTGVYKKTNGPDPFRMCTCVCSCECASAHVCVCPCVSIPNASVVRKKLIIRYNDEQVCDASYYGPITSIGLKLRQWRLEWNRRKRKKKKKKKKGITFHDYASDLLLSFFSIFFFIFKIIIIIIIFFFFLLVSVEKKKLYVCVRVRERVYETDI